MKSDIMRKIAAKLGLPIIDIKLSKSKHSDFLGQDLSTRGAIDETVDGIVETQIAEDQFIIASGPTAQVPADPNPVVFRHYQLDPVTGAPIAMLEEKRRINVGDMVLMEYAKGVVETVVVDEIEDGMVYATGDDGEPFCAPIANCDKVPY